MSNDPDETRPPQTCPRRLGRRAFMGAGLGAVGALATGCFRGAVNRTAPETFTSIPTSDAPGEVAIEFADRSDWRGLCERTLGEITDLSWLKPGDSVFIKVACNSSFVHPATTSPKAVTALVEFFQNQGAGQVYVGDQSGVASVRRLPDRRISSTRHLMRQNGLLEAIEAAGATPHFFDDHGWEQGYFSPTIDFETTWSEGLWLPKIIQEVDHIVYLTRLSSHVMAGYTAGIKIAVGWLRDDSREHLHRDAATFFERFAEINHVAPLRDKLRFVLTLGDAALLDFGPDQGAIYQFEHPHAIASRSLVDHDSVVASLLPWLDRDLTSVYDAALFYPRRSNAVNAAFVRATWGRESFKNYTRMVPPRDISQFTHESRGRSSARARHHLATLQRYRPTEIRLHGNPSSLPEGLLAHLKGVDEALRIA